MTKNDKGEPEARIAIGNARIIRDALPGATFIGFTGTPVSAKDRNTREVFGDYIDVYDMTQAVEDGATKPVYYESRVIKLNPVSYTHLDVYKRQTQIPVCLWFLNKKKAFEDKTLFIDARKLGTMISRKNREDVYKRQRSTFVGVCSEPESSSSAVS